MVNSPNTQPWKGHKGAHLNNTEWTTALNEFYDKQHVCSTGQPHRKEKRKKEQLFLPGTRERATLQCVSQCSLLQVVHGSLVQMSQRGKWRLWLVYSQRKTVHGALKRQGIWRSYFHSFILTAFACTREHLKWKTGKGGLFRLLEPAGDCRLFNVNQARFQAQCS